MNNQAFIKKVNLEEAGKGGYVMYRIPGIIVTQKGTVLAYYEGRMGKGDWTKQDIILRRSVDNGQTWSERIMLAQGSETESLSNSVMVADRNGDVHFLWHKNYTQCFYQKSADDGNNWSEPVEITEVFERFRKEYDWNIIASGPGHGIQLENGRLLVPVWISNGGKVHRPSVLSCIYSDDRGITWERGDIIWDRDGLINPSETAVVQLENGDVLMNIRHESEDCHRAVSISKDGVTGWSKPKLDEGLPDPICFGSLVRMTEKKSDGNSQILFCNCAVDGNPLLSMYAFDENTTYRGTGGQSRKHLTIRLSEDECHSWVFARELEEYSGYSDIAVSKDRKTIFCLYEKDWLENHWGNTKNITVAMFNLEWLIV